MATSGVWTYQVTALQIINSAAEDIGIRVAGQALNANDLATALTTLNLLVKQWQGTSDKFPGLKMWTRQRLAMFFVKSQPRYLIGPNSGDDRATVMVGSSASSSYQSTTLTNAKAANATSLVVGSTSGMTAADQIGIVLGDGTLGWTTISSVDSSTGLTLPANTLGAANANAVIFTYTSKAQRFVELEAAVLRDNTNPAQPIDIPINVYTDVQQFEQITQKNASGDPTAILVEPQRLNTAITCNFAPPNVYKLLRLTVIYPAEDYTQSSGADDIAFPQEYFAALEWELARRLAPKFGRPWTPDLAQNWQINVQDAISLNPQNTHISFEPGRDDLDVGSPFTRP